MSAPAGVVGSSRDARDRLDTDHPDAQPCDAGLAKVALLGPVEARGHNGNLIRLRTGRQAAILAVLALRANTSVDVDTLLGAVWDTPYPARATELLHTYLCRLRRAIQPDAPRWQRRGVLSNVGGSYTLSLPPAALDLHLFERNVAQASAARARGDLTVASGLLESGLAMWRGEPLAGLPGPVLERERTRLNERWLSTKQEHLELDLHLGRYPTVVPELRALVAEHPLQERLVELLMLGLYRSGRQSDALATYAATRHRLAEELGVEPVARLQATYLQILRAENEILTEDVAVVSGAAAVPDTAPADEPDAPEPARPPAQLPRDVAEFTGRTVESAHVASLLSTVDKNVGVPVAIVTGRPGVGKTALAVHVGHRVRELFPDGQVYLDLRGSDPRPVDPEDALRLLLAAVSSPSAPNPTSFAERVNLFRTTIAGRRILVVLDDAASERQVRPLLPGSPGCAVLVSSRTPLAGLDCARHLRLDSLDGADGRRLLRGLVGADRVDVEPDAATEVVAACAGLPLAIQVAAGRLTERPDWPLWHLARLLRDEGRRLDTLTVADRAVRERLATADARLAPALRHALLTLSLVDLPVLDAGSTAVVLGVSRSCAAELIDGLVFHHMLDVADWGPLGEVRVRFDALIRLYAREQAAAHVDSGTAATSSSSGD